MTKKQARLVALENQVKRLERRSAVLRSISNRYALIRLAIFIGGVAISIGCYYLGGWWLCLVGVVLSLLIFNVVAYYHRQIDRSLIRHKIWQHLKTTQIARMKLDWEHIPTAASLPTLSEHPFQTDLDLTGPRSVHQLIDTAASREGSQRLADWLLNTSPDAEVIKSRQALVGELKPLSRFRDKLALAATLASKDHSEQWEGRKLLAWLNRTTSVSSLRQTLIILVALSVTNIGLFGLGRLGVSGVSTIFIFTFPLYLGFYFTRAKGTDRLFDDAFALRDALRGLSAVLHYLETYHYGPHSELKKLCEPLLEKQNRPSLQLRRAARITSGAALQKNQILWLLVNLIVPWDIYFAYRLEECKKQVGALLPGWLEVWYELEALNSLANFGYLNPEYAFPQVEPDRPVAFEGRDLGHPLIPDEAKVCNDFRLDGPGEMVIITGSNMAGKSSFLRTLGVNLCLAYAGGVVNGASLQTGLFRVFTCIKVSDSVTDGYSYFYAEVRRLKALLVELDQPDPRPLFFLIDEIFKGTNNRERLIGSRSYLRALAGRHALGAVSTHDLELVRLADELPQIKNYHFREEVIDGQMVFDYRFRPGPSPTTNALKIMRLEGLPVDS